MRIRCRDALWVAVGVVMACAAPEATTAEPEPPTPLAAEEIDRLALSAALAYALRANPDIRIAALEVDRAETRVDAEKGRFDPVLFGAASRGASREPTATVPLGRVDREGVSVSAGVRKRLVSGTEVSLASQMDYDQDQGASNRLDPEYVSRTSLTVRQDVLRNAGVAVNRTGILIERNTARMSEDALRGTLLQQVFEVEQAYWNLYFGLADVTVREQQLERARELVRIAEARVNVGDAPPIEITRAEASVAIQSVAILEARNRAAKLRHRLLRRMGILTEARAGRALALTDAPPGEPVTLSLAEAMAAARASRPDLIRAERVIRNARLRERFARNQRLPALALYGDLGWLGLDDELSGDAYPGSGDDYDWEVGLVVEIPLPDRTARAAVKATRIERMQAEVQAADVLQTATREVADAIDDVSTTAQKVIRAGTARDLAQRLLEAEQKSFTLGRTESFNVLDAQAALAGAERDEIGARTDYATARANLYRVQGNLLQVKGISFARVR